MHDEEQVGGENESDVPDQQTSDVEDNDVETPDEEEVPDLSNSED